MAAQDLARARVAEGHADALAILAELGGPDEPTQRWGVWAARPDSVRAELQDRRWTLSGDRAWCSGAGMCTRALVAARAPDGVRLFVVSPADPRITVLPDTWPAVGMAASDSRTVRFRTVPAHPVGPAGAYTCRVGFWHGAIGVAACWYGGAVGIARLLLTNRQNPDPHGLAHLGAVDAALAGAGAALVVAARTIDRTPDRTHERQARRVRILVEAVASEVIERVGRATGSAPLTHDRAHARRVADLTVYLRQSHAERDLAALGDFAQQLDPRTAWELCDSNVPAAGWAARDA